MSLWQKISAQPRVLSIESPLRGWSNRTTVVELATRTLLAVNPCRNLSPAARAELDDLGAVSHLLAPNHYHHLGTGRWRTWYPDALPVAARLALPRLRRQGVVAADADAELADRLPPGSRLLVPAGTRNGEAWLSLATSIGRLWIVGDAIFNFRHRPRGVTGLVLERTGTVPGLRIGETFLRLALRDRIAFKSWILATLEEERPTQLLPAHGSPSCGYDLPQRIASLVTARVA